MLDRREFVWKNCFETVPTTHGWRRLCYTWLPDIANAVSGCCCSWWPLLLTLAVGDNVAAAGNFCTGVQLLATVVASDGAQLLQLARRQPRLLHLAVTTAANEVDCCFRWRPLLLQLMANVAAVSIPCWGNLATTALLLQRVATAADLVDTVFFGIWWPLMLQPVATDCTAAAADGLLMVPTVVAARQLLGCRWRPLLQQQADIDVTQAAIAPAAGGHYCSSRWPLQQHHVAIAPAAGGHYCSSRWSLQQQPVAIAAAAGGHYWSSRWPLQQQHVAISAAVGGHYWSSRWPCCNSKRTSLSERAGYFCLEPIF